MPIMDQITSGSLYLQVKGLLRSQKSKKYGVLYGKTPDTHPYLALYDSKEDYENFIQNGKKCEMKKIDLRHIKTINNQTQSSGKSQEFQTEIRTKKEKTTLLFDTEAESRKWSGHLNGLVVSSDKHDETSTSSVHDAMTTSGDDDDDDNEFVTVNELYGGGGEVSRFDVTVDDTELAQLCNIIGKRTLVVGELSMAFENVTTRRIDYSFQIAWLRRFGKKETLFSFEVGRSCPNGSGQIKCHTSSAKFIHKIVSDKSHSRGTTVIPSRSTGISAAQNNIRHVIEKAVEPVEPEDGQISGPVLHVQKRHPGLGSGPRLIPLKTNNNTSDGDSFPTSNTHSNERTSTKSLNGERINGKRSGSIKHVSEDFTKRLEDTFSEPQSKESIKSKDKDSKKKEQDRKKEERENKKREEKKEKERKKEKKQKEKAKKDEEKAKKDEKKERVQPATPTKPVGGSPGLYEEVNILDNTPSPDSKPDISYGEPHYSEQLREEEDLYDQANSPTQADPVEYASPVRNRIAHTPCEYSDVKTVNEDAWRRLGRTEGEEEHTENYSVFQKARSQIEGNPPPLPGRSYDQEEEDDDTYNRITLKSSHSKDKPKTNAMVETQNIYGTASAKEVETLDSIYDSADTYDCPEDLVSSNRSVDDYEEAKPKSRPAPRNQEEALYDQVT